jgi:hypothetical protein
VALDKSEGGVKDKLLLSVFFAPLLSPERVEDQDSGILTLNHPAMEDRSIKIVPPTIDSA